MRRVVLSGLSVLIALLLPASCAAFGAALDTAAAAEGGAEAGASTVSAGPSDAGVGPETSPVAVVQATVVAAGLDLPTKITADDAALYVTTGSSAGSVLILDKLTRASTIFAAGFGPPSFIAANTDYVYWTTSQGVFRKEKGSSSTLSFGASSPPTGLATIKETSIVFALPGSGTSVSGLVFASTDFKYETLGPSIASVSALAAAGKEIFLGVSPATGTDSLRRYSTDAPTNELTPSADVFGPIGTLAATDDRVVFADRNGTVYELKTAQFQSAGASHVLAAGTAVVDIALDAARQLSYWITTDGIVHRHSWASGDVSAVGRGPAPPGGLASDTSHLYWTCPMQGSVMSLPK